MVIKTENCVWQELLDKAHDAWNKHNDSLTADYEAGKITADEVRENYWNFRDVLDIVCDDDKMRAACIFGKLNYQIENGGVMQWVDNRYAYYSIDWLQEYLEATGPIGKKIWKLLSPFLRDFMDEETGYLAETDEEEWEDLVNSSDYLSDEFYKLQDDWHKEVYEYLS